MKDKEFERIAYKYLKRKFDRVEWLSMKSMAPIDFKCFRGEQSFLIEAKFKTNDGKVRLSPRQRKVDAVVICLKGEPKLIWKKDFQNFVYYDKMHLVKVPESIYSILTKMKKGTRKTYGDIVEELLLRKENLQNEKELDTSTLQNYP